MTDQGPFIERCPHDKENPYAQTSRALIRDERLHPCTRWMLIYLLSMKDGWKISVKQVREHVLGHRNCGRDKVYEWIKEAIELGYMFKKEWLEGGKNRCCYLLSETPKFKNILPDPVIQDPVKKDPATKEHKKEHKKEITPPNPLKGEGSQSEPMRAREEKKSSEEKNQIKRALGVSTTREEHERLIEKFGIEMVQKAYKYLSEWKKEKPLSKRKGNDNLKIQKWVIAAVIEKEQRDKKVEEYYKNSTTQNPNKKGKGLSLIHI